MIDRSDDRGSTIPMILGFFVLAALLVAASIALGQAFVQQRDLQSVCDGAAAAAAAGGGSLDRGDGVGTGDSLRFDDVGDEVRRYLARDDARQTVRFTAELSADNTQVTLRCTQRLPLTFGALFGRGTVRHTALSSARAAVVE